MQNRIIHQLQLKSGFTLVELMVAVFAFTVLFAISGGIVVNILNNQRKAFNMQTIESNASFILEQLSREIRAAQLPPDSDTNCPSVPSNSLTFTHPQLGLIRYYVQGSSLHKTVAGVDTVITAPDITLNSASFCTKGTAIGVSRQPSITVVLDLKKGGTSPKLSANAVIQFTVVPRLLKS